MDDIYLILMFTMFLGISLSLIAQEIVADKDDNCDDNEQEYKITDDMVFITINNQKMASDVTSGDFYITEYVKLSDKTVWFVTSKDNEELVKQRRTEQCKLYDEYIQSIVNK